MSRVIAQMLDYPEHQVKKLITKIEDKNGYPSHDVRLLAENIQKIRQKMVDLNLDPDDTTATELYHALLVKFNDDSRRYDEYFGVQDQSYDQKAKKAIEIISNNVDLPDVWVLKGSVAKTLLKQHQPHRLMKALHYRSVDSLLKREELAKIYLVLGTIESDAWNKAHSKLVSSLDSTSFERRKLKLGAISNSYLVLSKTGLNISYNPDYGVLGLLSSDILNQAGLLTLVVSLLDYLTDFSEIKAAKTVAGFSPTAAWWADMDHLIARIASEHVSLNLKDVAHNQLLRNELGEHKLEAGQKSFWKELISRYPNRHSIDEDLLPPLTSFVKVPTNQPAFEYVEDI